MPALILVLVLSIAQATDGGHIVRAGVRDPAYASTGRLAFEVNGDIWISGVSDGRLDMAADELAQVTSGPAWDRGPVWMPGGRALIFVSDRAGTTDLWRIPIDGRGRPGEASRVTESPEPDTEPTVGPDGTIVFVRGRNATADLWARSPDGEERQLTDKTGAERSPTFSPDGSWLAYVSGRELRRRQLEVGDEEVMGRDPGTEATEMTGSSTENRPVDEEKSDDVSPALPRNEIDEEGVAEDELIVSDVFVVDAAWSPRGDLIAYSTSGRRGGVYVTPEDGRYANLVFEETASIAWSPDGTQLVLAELPRSDPSYNGDPDRIGDRRVGDLFPVASGTGRLWVVEAPRPLDSSAIEVPVDATVDRSGYNAEAFDRVWDRLSRLYYQEAGKRERWEDLRESYRLRALTAVSDEQLEETIHEMLSVRPPAREEVIGRAAVSSAHPLATAAGIEILQLGGNVVDAAIAVSFALGVVEPDASGIGGYGQMVVYLADMEEPIVIEFLTRAPEAATLDNATLQNPEGPVLANVPGTVRGMELALERYGSGEVEWERLLAPAIQLAEEGFVLDDAFTTTLSLERDQYLKYEGSKALFFPDGEPLRPGDVLENPDLAWTLRKIADGGADAFYEGEVAEKLVADLRGRGNAMTLRDMARYFAVEREPVVGSYRGHTIYSGAPAVSGGASLVAKLNLLDNEAGLGLYTDNVATLHALIEAWKLQPSAFGRIADPDLWPVDLEPFVDRRAAAERWSACFDEGRSIEPEDLEYDDDNVPACARLEQDLTFAWGDEIFDCEGPGCRVDGTTAFAVADADGNIVAVTQTLGTWGGNFYVTPGLGFLYNDKLRSYGSNPARFGARLPYARNATSIAPTLVFTGTGTDKRPYLAVGAAGNAWITAAVYEVISGIIDGGLGPQQALELPRFLVGVRRDPDERREVEEIVVQVEDLVAPRVLRQLQQMGHSFQKISLRGELRMGYGAAVMIEEGRVRAGADPRRSGAAGAIR